MFCALLAAKSLFNMWQVALAILGMNLQAEQPSYQDAAS